MGQEKKLDAGVRRSLRIAVPLGCALLIDATCDYFKNGYAWWTSSGAATANGSGGSDSHATSTVWSPSPTPPSLNATVLREAGVGVGLGVRDESETIVGLPLREQPSVEQGADWRTGSDELFSDSEDRQGKNAI